MVYRRGTTFVVFLEVLPVPTIREQDRDMCNLFSETQAKGSKSTAHAVADYLRLIEVRDSRLGSDLEKEIIYIGKLLFSSRTKIEHYPMSLLSFTEMRTVRRPRPAQLSGRQKIKLDDIKFACRKNEAYLGKIQEALDKKAEIDFAKKLNDDKITKSNVKALEVRSILVV